jgi:uncharacterized membrane protein YfcA
MERLLAVALAGFAASLVDGALGMGYGPTSSTILLAAGLAPASVSLVVNLSKVASGVAGGAAHWKFGNYDTKVIWTLIPAGCAGALIGSTLLSNVDPTILRPVLGGILVVIALRMLLRFARASANDSEFSARPLTRRNRLAIAAAGLCGGVTNGLIGAWGPVVTPALMAQPIEPRVVIGSVNIAEIAVALTASATLLGSLGSGAVDGGLLLALLIGGVLAAPVAAWLVRLLPARPLGVAVGALLLFTNTRDLAGWRNLGPERWALYGAVVVLAVLAAVAPRLRGASGDAALEDAEAGGITAEIAAPTHPGRQPTAVLP